MDPSFPEFLENTVFHLQKTFTSGSSADIESSQKVLKSMSSQHAKFLEILLVIITDQKTAGNLKMAASVYFIKTLREKLQNISLLKLESRVNYVTLISQIFLEERLELRFKRQFLTVLNEILECDIDEKVMLDVLDKTEKNLSNPQNHHCFVTGLLFIISLYSKKTYSNSELLFSCFRDEQMPRILDALGFLLPQIETISSANLSDIEKMAEMLGLICEVFEVYVQSMKERNEKFLAILFEEAKLIPLLWNVVRNVNLGQKSILMEELIEKGLNFARNIVVAKFKCLKVLQFCVQNYLENEQKNRKFPLFMPIFMEFLRETVGRLSDFANEKSRILVFLNGNSKNEVKELLYQYLAFFNAFVQEAKNPLIYQIISSSKENLILELILPLLLTSMDEITEFNENPASFVDFSSKITENFDLEVIKPLAAVILVGICSKIDGALPFLFRTLENNLRCWLKGENSDQRLADLLFFSQDIALEARVEASFLVFSVVSHLICKRDDLLYAFYIRRELEDLLHDFFEVLFVENKNKLIKSRLCLFSSYFMFSLFKNNHKQRYLSLFEFVFSCLSQDSQSRAIVLQAIDTLNYVVVDSSDYERIKPIITGLLGFVKQAQIIENIQEFTFFEFLATAIKNYNVVISREVFADCVGAVVARIKSELTSNNNSKSGTNVLECCLNFLLLICEDDYVLGNFREEIEFAVSPLVYVLFDLKNYELFDSILMIFYRIINERKSIPQYLIENPSLLPKIFGNSGKTFGNLFQIINQFLVFGREVLVHNLGFLEEILKICLEAIQNKGNDELNQIKAGLLIHLVIEVYKDVIQNDTLVLVLTAIGEASKGLKKGEYTDLVFFEVYELGIIFLPTMTLDYLIKSQKINEILDKISKINYISCFPYDIQILILTFCSLIHMGSSEIYSSPIFRKIFALVVEIQAYNHIKKNITILSPLISKHQGSESKRKAHQKIAKKEDIEIEENKEESEDIDSKNDDLDSFDYNESQSFQYQFEHPGQKLELLIRNFINPIKKENEIHYFQETMRKFKSEKREIFEVILEDLSEKNRKKLTEIMSLRKIEDTEGSKEHLYRKVLTIKGKKKVKKQVNFENQDMEYKDSLYFDLY